MDWLASLEPSPASEAVGLQTDANISEDCGQELTPSASCSEQFPPAGQEGQGNVALVEDPISWLVEFGFASEVQCRAALEQAGGDSDEALQILRMGADMQSSKRRRCSEATANSFSASDQEFEIEGFSCRARDKSLVLRLPHAGCIDGPTVGRIRKDGSMSFCGLDEWTLDLYEAKPLSSDISAKADFDIEAAASALQCGAPVVLKSFATPAEIQEAHSELEVLRVTERFQAKTAATTADVKGRSDRVAFLEIEGTSPECPPCCLALLSRLKATVAAIEWSADEQLLCPRQAMAAVYDGAGAHYAAHRDNELCTGSNGRPWVNFRVLTAIIYVNPSGFEGPEHGGQLRCYVGANPDDLIGSSATRVEDVLPKCGTAVVFPSRTTLHEVLPSFSRRYALSLWFLGVSIPKQHAAAVERADKPS